LRTAGAAFDDLQPDWRTRALAALTNPSVALILMMLGIYGLMFEFMSPGAVVPGVAGAICLLLALYGLQLLPVNYSGLALILLGVLFMIAEAFLPSFGAIGLGGVIAFVIGAVLLALTANLALRSRRRKGVSGVDTLIGSVGEMLGDAQREGWANIGGETWRVFSDSPVSEGQGVRVLARRGPALLVEPVNTASKGA
jgi:membrane-bound serine protease (ClpP class)